MIPSIEDARDMIEDARSNLNLNPTQRSFNKGANREAELVASKRAGKSNRFYEKNGITPIKPRLQMGPTTKPLTSLVGSGRVIGTLQAAHTRKNYKKLKRKVLKIAPHTYKKYKNAKLLKGRSRRKTMKK
jgi:hypothetical protein